MPQYLGIHYLQHALEKTCVFLTSALLPAPDHLDKVENYPHKGIPSEHDIRQFQIKDIASMKIFCETDISIHDSFKLLCERISLTPLDAFDGESQEVDGIKSLEVDGIKEDVIFSSFNSPDSCELVYIQPSSPERNMSQSEDIEIFRKEDFEEIRKEIDKDHKWLLEDVYCSNLFKECLQKLPTLKTYVERLNLMKIADPLLSPDGSLLSENKFFQTNYSFSLEKQSFTEIKEVFLPITGLQTTVEKSPYFEEVMTSVLHYEFRSTQLNAQQLKESLQLKEFSVQLNEEADINTLLAEQNVKLLPYESHEKLFESDAIENNTHIFIEKEATSRMPMNHLETPITSPVKENLQKPNIINLLETVPFIMNDEMNHVLSPQSVDKIKRKYWQEEKYCDEVSTLVLPEPIIEASSPVHSYFKTVLECKNFSPENISSEVELVLNWDPFQDLTFNRKQFLVNLDYENQIPFSENFDDVFVKNKKFMEDPNQDSFLDQAELHKTIQWSSNSIYKSKDQLMSQKVISPTKNVNLGLNPLEDFFMMRFGCQNSKITTDKETADEWTTKTSDEKARKKDFTEHNEYKFIENILSVPITGEFNFLLQEISNSAEPFMKLLQTSGDLASSKLFQDLQPDMTGFLLNQKQKSLQKAVKKDFVNEELEAMTAVHILVSTADVLLNCSFESAIIHLSEMIENHSSLQGCFENLRNTFFKARNNFLQQNIIHPKIVSISKEIEKWQLQNKIKSNFNGKILIIIQRNISGLMAAILDHILLGTKTKAEIFDSTSNKKNVQERLSTLTSTVILLQDSVIMEDFPWPLFSLVIQYEHDKKARDYLKLCESRGITFCSLQTAINTNARQNPSISKCNSSSIDNELIKLIGSEAITHNKQLLQLLETRYNIVIIGRMLHQLSATRRLYFADIVIDERNCIVLCSPSQLQAELLEPFILRLFCLNIKFSFCYIIITQTTAQPNSDQITDVSCNLSKLIGTLGILSKNSECTYKVLLSHKINETAVFIREISEHCLNTSKVWSHQQWLERDWLSEDISKEEKFLLNWPCLNSFCAQFMLKSTSLKQLLVLPVEHLKHRFQWLPQQVIELFHQITNKDSGLQLKVTNIPTISFPSQPTSQNKQFDLYEPTLQSQAITNKRSLSPTNVEDLPLTKEIHKKNMPHFKNQKKYPESQNSCLNDNSEFLVDIPDLEFYPTSQKEEKFSYKYSTAPEEDFNDFRFFGKENLSSDKRNLEKKSYLTIDCSPHFDDFQLDYNLGTQNLYSNKFDTNPSNDLNFASLSDPDPQMVMSQHLPQQKTKLSQEIFLMGKERKKSMKVEESDETGSNSWTQFFEDFRTENRNKKIMAVSPRPSPDLTIPISQTNYCPIDPTAMNRFSSLDYFSSSKKAPNPYLQDLKCTTTNEEVPQSRCSSFPSTEKPYRKPAQTKNPSFSQFSNRTKMGNPSIFKNYNPPQTFSDLGKRPLKMNQIFPDKFSSRELESQHRMKKRVNIGLAQPRMRNSQETGFMASQSVRNHGSETELNNGMRPSARHQCLKSPESEMQFLPSSQFYSGFTSQNNKKRRLTFEKIPGQKDGQTKLSFS